ncbi:urease accessory protein UreD [Xylanibacillus composti]|nr:urease accessory protein UreD [Xylanibacillus composti]
MSLIKPAAQHDSAASIPAAPGVRGKLTGRFACKNKRTFLADRYHQAPLKISKTFPMEEGGQLAVYMMDASPGMLDGDRYDISMELEAGASVYLTNQSFTKIHPASGAGSRLTQHFQLGAGSLLEFFPEPMIPYARSRIDTHTRIELEEDAVLLFGDVVTPGRTHRNELFQYGLVDSKVEIFRNGRLTVWDRFLLQPAVHDVRGLAAFGSYTHMASMWILAPRADELLLERIREELGLAEKAPDFDLPGPSAKSGEAISAAESEPSATCRLPGGAACLTGASMTADRGIVIRVLGHNVWQLQHQLFTARRAARRYLFNWDTAPERK